MPLEREDGKWDIGVEDPTANPVDIDQRKRSRRATPSAACFPTPTKTAQVAGGGSSMSSQILLLQHAP
jgi:hypothetical protein